MHSVFFYDIISKSELGRVVLSHNERGNVDREHYSHYDERKRAWESNARDKRNMYKG